MSGGYPILGELCAGTDYGTDTTNLRGVAIAQGGASSYGSYTQLIASTSQDAIWAFISLQTNGSSNTKNINLIRFAMGAAGSEVIVADGIPLVMPSTGWQNIEYYFPVSVPAGSRVAAANAGGDIIYIQAILFDASMNIPAEAAGIEPVTSNLATGVCAVVTAGTSPAKGSYAQVVAATSRDYCGLVMVLSPQVYGGSSPGTDQEIWDVAIGASGSEVAIIPNDIYVWNGAQIPQPRIYMIDIPAGSRLSVRFGSLAGSTVLGVTLLGIYK